MRTPLQRRTDNSAQQSPDNVSQAGRSAMPPEMTFSDRIHNATLRNGISDDTLNDAVTDQYQPHPNDPAPWAENPHNVVYGPEVEGDLYVQGQGDRHSMDPNDVQQGRSMGNCYFLSALAGLARQQPELIKNAIEGPLDDGTYNVTLYTSSGWDEQGQIQQKTINVSTAFMVWGEFVNPPVESFHEWTGNDAFAQRADRDEAGNEELWVKLIEKAYATLVGGWEEVDGGIGGWPMIALEALTGERHTEHFFNGVPERFEHLAPDVLTRPSSTLDNISTEELQLIVISNLEDGNVVTAEDNGHSVTVWEADENGITLRDQQDTEDGNTGIITLTWDEFRAKYIKISTKL